MFASTAIFVYVSAYFFFSSRRRHTRCLSDWSSDVCSSDLDFRFPSNDAIQSDIKPMKLQEMVFGADHELSPVLSVGLRYVHKQIDRAIEDRSEERRVGKECRSRRWRGQ